MQNEKTYIVHSGVCPDSYSMVLRNSERTVHESNINVSESNGTAAVVKVENGRRTPSPVKQSIKPAESSKVDYYHKTQENNIVKISDGCGYVNDEILIFFKDGTPLKRKLEIVRSVDASIVGYLGILNRYQLHIKPSNIDEIKKICNSLMKNKEVELAGCNFAYKISKTSIPSDPWTGTDGGNNTYGWDEECPSGSNWWLEAIQAPSAWDYKDYFNHIDIGVVDSGFDLRHEDLQGKILFSQLKAQEAEFIDDHGTHVAGIIAANADNNIGITGICNNCTLHCVDWEPVGFQFWSTEERLLTGLAYTVRDGAKVINYSVGATASMPTEDFLLPFYKMFLNIEAKYYSYSMAKLLRDGYDYIVVQSSGNGSEEKAEDAFLNGMFCSITEDNAFTGSTGISAKQIVDRIIIVGAAQNMGSAHFRQAEFSNGGKLVDICAPGYDVFQLLLNRKRKYCYMSGTSMSAPVVTAVTALAWSVKPDLPGDVIKQIVCDPENTCYEVADNPSQFHPLVDTYRMVNAKLAVEAVIKLTQTAES